MFAEHQVNKTYMALVLGRTHKKGVIRRQLEDQRRGHALDAVTRYRTTEQLPGVSLLRVTPETGRKHQIRRHFWGIGHPLVGDQVYRPKRRRKVFAYPGRLWLHAAALTLPDGRTFEAPLPTKLDEHLSALRKEAQKQQDEREISAAQTPDVLSQEPTENNT
jgi:23S rRNA-/tRNA-specific pseudouridylate synthase